MSNYDSWNSHLYGLPYPIYFYVYSRSSYDGDTEGANRDSAVGGNCPAILSSQLVPYLTKADLDFNPLKYDTFRFGKISPERPQMETEPWVYRVNSIKENSRLKDLATFQTYPDSGKDTGISKGRYWKNESKLLQYPYSFAIISDGLAPPLQIQYHLCKNAISQIKVRNTLSDRCSYGLFIEGYKGDDPGSMEAMISGDAHELPCSSSSYSQWFASSKATTQAQVSAQIQQGFLSVAQSNQMTGLQNFNQMMAPMTGLATGGLLGGLGGAISMLPGMAMNNMNNTFAQQNASLNKQTAINGALAQEKDRKSTPNTMVSMGSDLIYGHQKGGGRLNLYRYSITTEYATKIADYFAMYGYKQNKIINVEEIKRNRYYYNYVKTTGCNLKSNGAIAKEHMDTMKSILDKGITIWHIDREGVIISDYSKDNTEV